MPYFFIFWEIDWKPQFLTHSAKFQQLHWQGKRRKAFSILKAAQHELLFLLATSDEAAQMHVALTSSPTRRFKCEPLLGEIPTWLEASSCFQSTEQHVRGWRKGRKKWRSRVKQRRGGAGGGVDVGVCSGSERADCLPLHVFIRGQMQFAEF